MASGHVNRTKGRTHGSTDPCDVKKALANPEPSTHGSKRTWPSVRRMSAFGVEADMASSRLAGAPDHMAAANGQ